MAFMVLLKYCLNHFIFARTEEKRIYFFDGYRFNIFIKALFQQFTVKK